MVTGHDVVDLINHISKVAHSIDYDVWLVAVETSCTEMDEITQDYTPMQRMVRDMCVLNLKLNSILPEGRLTKDCVSQPTEYR